MQRGDLAKQTQQLKIQIRFESIASDLQIRQNRQRAWIIPVQRQFTAPREQRFLLQLSGFLERVEILGRIQYQNLLRVFDSPVAISLLNMLRG